MNHLRDLLKQRKIPGVLEISEVMTFPPTRADEIRLRIKDVISIQITGWDTLTFNFRPYQTKTQPPDNERFVQLMTDVVHKTLGKKNPPQPYYKPRDPEDGTEIKVWRWNRLSIDKDDINTIIKRIQFGINLITEQTDESESSNDSEVPLTPTALPAKKPKRVFISFKRTDINDKDTPDFKIAHEIYKLLENRGISTFLCDKTLIEQGTDDYLDSIMDAIKKADIFVLVATSPEHVMSGFVKTEWTSFHHVLLNTNNPQKRLFTYLSGFHPRELPLPLPTFQSFSHDKDLERLFEAIAAALGLSHIEDVAQKGNVAIERLEALNDVMAKTRILELEIFIKNPMGSGMMSEDQRNEMLKLIEKLRSFTRSDADD